MRPVAFCTINGSGILLHVSWITFSLCMTEGRSPIAFGPNFEFLDLRVGRLADNFSRDSNDDRARGNDVIFTDERAGGDQSALPDLRPSQKDRADPDERPIADLLGVNHRMMADRHVLPNHHILAWIAVKHTVVLDVGSLADRDRGHVPTDYGAIPDRDPTRTSNGADHRRIFGDPESPLIRHRRHGNQPIAIHSLKRRPPFTRSCR